MKNGFQSGHEYSKDNPRAYWSLAQYALFGLVIISLAACSSDNGEVATHTVRVEVGDNGSVSPESAQTVDDGETVQFELLPDSDYEIDQVEGCGGELDGTAYTTAALSEDCTVTVSFKLIPPNAPTLNLSPTAIKTFSFSWTDVSGESEYRLLENPDGESGYTQVATLPADTTEHDLEVFLPGRINASYILEACNSGGCSESGAVHVSGTLTEAVGYFKASNTSAEDEFGTSVALSDDGKTLAVGARWEDSDATGIDGDQENNDASGSGAVYVFAQEEGVWLQQAYVKASNTGTGDDFGRSVALSGDGDTLAVGAPWESSDATGIGGDQDNNSATDSGAVYVFVRAQGAWSQQAYVKASNTAANALFGHRVTLSEDGNTLAVSALRENTDADNSGAAYVFTRTGTFWSEHSFLKASNAAEEHEFGGSIALSGDGETLAVGAAFEDSSATGIGGDQNNHDAEDSGAVYVFFLEDDDWSQQAYIKASNASAGDQFGHSVALSGDGSTLAAGAWRENNGAEGVDGAQSGTTVNRSGSAYVFVRDADDWSQQAYIKASNTGSFNHFGVSLSLADDGNALAVGARGENSAALGIEGSQNNSGQSNSGAAYLFIRESGAWSQQVYIKAPNTGSGDSFGHSLSLSGDGKSLAVGANREDSNATGIGGNLNDNTAENSGAVYLY